jgi:hypothetical protein
MHDLFYPGYGDFDIDPYPVVFAHNGCRIIATMRNGKMKGITWQKGLSCISDPYKFIWESGKKKLKQETASQVLQSFVRMGDIPVLGNISLEEIFSFFYLPYAQPGGFVDLLLKKNRHRTNLRFKIAHLTAIPETFLNTPHDFIGYKNTGRNK